MSTLYVRLTLTTTVADDAEAARILKHAAQQLADCGVPPAGMDRWNLSHPDRAETVGTVTVDNDKTWS